MVSLNFLLLFKLFMAKFYSDAFKKFGGWFCTFMENDLTCDSRLLKREVGELICVFFFTVLDLVQTVHSFPHER